MTHVLRYSPAVTCLGVITFLFWLATAYQPEPVGIERAMLVIGAPILLTVAGWFVLGIGRLSRRRYREGERSAGWVLALVTALG